MNFIDLSNNLRIAKLRTLLPTLRGAQTPFEVIKRYFTFLSASQNGRANMVLITRNLPPGQYHIWRLTSPEGEEQIPLQNPWGTSGLPILTSGIIDQIIQTRVPRLVHNIDWATDPESHVSLHQYHSLIAVPALSDEVPLDWSFLLHSDPEHFTSADVEQSVTRTTLIGSMLDTMVVSRQLAQAHAYIDQEIDRMARIQRALLPNPIPQIPGLQIDASYQTFSQVGGDLYDFLPLGDPDDRFCFFIGDASGHGPSAAVAAAMVQATLHATAAHSDGPADLCRILNAQLCQKPIEGSFVTAFIAFYNPRTRRLTYASAGHPPPFLLRASDICPLDAASGLPLGIESSAEFDQATLDLSPGQTLLLYTDGITEARGPDHSMFGSEGIEKSLGKKFSDASSVLTQLAGSLAAHQRGQKPTDDQTAVAIHVQA